MNQKRGISFLVAAVLVGIVSFISLLTGEAQASHTGVGSCQLYQGRLVRFSITRTEYGSWRITVRPCETATQPLPQPSKPAPAPAPAPATPPAGEGAASGLDAAEQEFANLVNNYRIQNGKQPLQISATLSNAAQWMADDIKTRGFTGSHNDNSGRTFSRRFTDFGYTCRYGKVGENLTYGSSQSPQTAFNLLRNSPGHNANMLDPAYKVMGIGHSSASWVNGFGGC